MILLPNFWRRHFLGLELSIAVIAAAALAIWVYQFGGATTFEMLLDGNRANIYRTTATMAVSLFGFSLTVISIVVGFSSYDRLAVVRSSKHYVTLWKVFFQAVVTLGLLSIFAFICLVFDSDKSPIIWLEILFSSSSFCPHFDWLDPSGCSSRSSG